MELTHRLNTLAKMSEVSLLIRKQEKKMTEVLVKKTHFTHVEVERLFQIYRWSLKSTFRIQTFWSGRMQ